MEKVFTDIIIHFDEINLKGNNRSFFVGKLMKNIRFFLGHGFAVKREEGKIVIKADAPFDLDKMKILSGSLALIPGIANFSAGIECGSEIELIKKSALAVARVYRFKTFKVEATRSFKSFPLNSMEIDREIGASVLNSFNEIKVDVHNPELIIGVEVGKEKSFVIGLRQTGIGGLPVGTSGKVIALLSGGIDSPVAAFQMMKRGSKVVFVHFHNQSINQAGVENKIRRLAEKLARVQGASRLYVVPFAELQKEVIAKIPADVRMIVYRRLMFKIAEQIARREEALALVTGDSLAQVASQTMENLSAIYAATDMLKLSPLIGFNKTEIVALAKKIGTYDISIEPYGDCCSLLVARHPETRADLKRVLKAEEAIDVEEKIGEALKKTKIFNV